MSSDSDQYVFENSVEAQENPNLFQSKKWTYITDSTSTNGSWNGQLQFDLGTLSSQNQWTNLSEAVIEFPVKLSLTNTTANAPATATILSAAIKNGFHQFVDSVQITLGGSTIQSSQIFTNIDATYKMLTEWSLDELRKHGPTLGVSLDDYLGTTDTAMGITDSLDNAALTTAATGFDMSYAKNPGMKERMLMLNNDVTSTCLGQALLGTNAPILGKGRVQSNAAVATANSDIFVLYALGTIRLKDISDAVKKLPLMKSLKGFIYVNYNAGVSTITNTAGASTITSVSNTARFGRTMPAMVNEGTGGLTLNATNAAPITFTAEISAVQSTLTGATPQTQTARLIAPYYVASPEVDRALTMKKTIRYNERFVTQFSITANGQQNLTLTPGISNPKRVTLFPYFTGAGTSGNSGYVANPLLSPWDSSPATTSPFAALKELQFYVGNVPMFQSPSSLDWQAFQNEVAEDGVDGGQNVEHASGLLSQRLWNQLYRYYTCNIGRRLGSEDGASKSIQVQCTNATTCPMTVISNIWYEREITVDTAMGTITQGF